MGCIKVTTITAYCAEYNDGYKIDTIRVRYKPPRKTQSVRKYIACGDTSNTQEMYAYFPQETPSQTETDVWTEEFFNTGFICDDGGCTNYNTRIDNTSNSCELGDGKYDVAYTKTIKDPSLACIVKMASKEKRELYDFSNEFGVNTNFCRVYCSDQIEYRLADKTKANSGRPFIYDVRTYKGDNNENYLFSAVVAEKRSCVSEIYYDHLPNDVDWKQIYGLTNQENADLRDTAKGGLTWSHLFNIIYDKSAS